MYGDRLVRLGADEIAGRLSRRCGMTRGVRWPDGRGQSRQARWAHLIATNTAPNMTRICQESWP
jgi:hypothetical protein